MTMAHEPRIAARHAIKDAVRGGLGAAILGELTLSGRARDTGLQSRPLAPPLFRDVGLIARSPRQPNPVRDALRGVLRETVAAIVPASLQ
jgi:DNA-binding transcriptional LysR family regulator